MGFGRVSRLGLIVGMLFCGARFGEAQTVIPLRDAVTLGIGRATVKLNLVGETIPQASDLQMIGTRLATAAELASVLTTDTDQDGIPNLLDAKALDPYCGSPDGSYADLVDADHDGRPACLDVDDTNPLVQLTGDAAKDAQPSSDAFTVTFLQFPGATALAEHYLEENRDQGSIYPATSLIAIADQGGFPSETIDRWLTQFGCGHDLRKACEKACRDRFLGPHADGRAHSECQKKCKDDIPDCAGQRPKKAPLGPRRTPPPGSPVRPPARCCTGLSKGGTP